MTTLIPARRAAEEFARVVDGSKVDVADRYTDLTACVDLLRAQETPAPRAEFVADLRTRLMAAADTLMVPAEPTPAPVLTMPDTRTRRRQRHLGAAAAAFVLVGGTAGIAAAAEGSLPGEPLYPIKRGIESAQISLNSSDAAKGHDLITQAGTRLDEVTALVDDRESAPQITHTLASFQRSASSGADLLFVTYQRDSDADDLTGLRTTFADQSTRLADLARRAPAGSKPAFDRATSLLSDLDQQARVLCSCGPDGGASLSSAPALQSLLTQPAAAAAADALASQKQALADKASHIAENTPNTTAPTLTRPDGSPLIPSPLPGISVPSQPTQNGLPKTTVGVATDGVQGLLNEVDSATGGGTAPLTDTLNSTLSSVTNPLLP